MRYISNTFQFQVCLHRPHTTCTVVHVFIFNYLLFTRNRIFYQSLFSIRAKTRKWNRTWWYISSCFSGSHTRLHSLFHTFFLCSSLSLSHSLSSFFALHQMWSYCFEFSAKTKCFVFHLFCNQLEYADNANHNWIPIKSQLHLM